MFDPSYGLEYSTLHQLQIWQRFWKCTIITLSPLLAAGEVVPKVSFESLDLMAYFIDAWRCHSNGCRGRHLFFDVCTRHLNMLHSIWWVIVEKNCSLRVLLISKQHTLMLKAIKWSDNCQHLSILFGPTAVCSFNLGGLNLTGCMSPSTKALVLYSTKVKLSSVDWCMWLLCEKKSSKFKRSQRLGKDRWSVANLQESFQPFLHRNVCQFVLPEQKLE